jgi:polyisoprenyl-phosphate glycosyltransferase
VKAAAYPLATPPISSPTQGTAPIRLSCVIPGKNEAANLRQLLPVLSARLSDICGPEGRWEIIVVDDGSRDDTVATVQPWVQAHHPDIPEGCGVRLLELSRNFGKEAALTAGMQVATGDAVVLMDADLQHPPDLVPTLVEHWRGGADMVYTVRRNRDDETTLKRVGSAWFYGLMNSGDRFEVPSGAGDFRLMDRQVVQALLALPERNRFMKGLYAWVGFKTVAVAYQPAPRASGRSTFNYLSLLKLSIDGLTAFTNWPLRAVGVLGFILAIFGLGYGAWETLSYFIWGNEVSGWTTIVVGMFVFFGVQMLSLGVLGEYIGRIFEEVKGRPLYVVRRDWGRGLGDPSSDDPARTP